VDCKILEGNVRTWNDKNLHLNLYADADFAGLWGSESGTDSMSVKSLTGNLITLGETPVVWMSNNKSVLSVIN